MSSLSAHELSQSICRASLLHRATGHWLELCLSWRAKAFRLSRRRSRHVGPLFDRGDHRARLWAFYRVWIAHADRGIFSERRNGGRLFHVLRGKCKFTHLGSQVLPDHEWRRIGPRALLDLLFLYLLRPRTLELRCSVGQRQKQRIVHTV